MKQIKKIIFLIIMLFAFSLNIKAKTVCEYGDDLTLTFANGDLDIHVEDKFYTNYFEGKASWFFGNFESNFDDVKPTDVLDEDLIHVDGACPYKLAYCKYEELNLGFHPFENIGASADAIKATEDGKSAEEVIKLLLSPRQRTRIVYYGETKEKLIEENQKLLDVEDKKAVEGVDAWLTFKNIFTENRKFSDRALKLGELYVKWKTMGFYSLANYTYKYKECGTVLYEGDLPTYSYACTDLTNYIVDYSKAAEKYKEADRNTKVERLASVKEKENQIRQYCKTILQNFEYDGSLEGDCIDSCLNIEDTIYKFRKKNGLVNTASTECGFSKRLLNFVANVMKWVKFILPVIVIVLGILDFIKAIGAEKDDDIKKAQKKFIYRLIAAALIFIVPFILEFVLDKLGFSDYTSGCGVITEIE